MPLLSQPALASALTFGEPAWWWALLALPVFVALYLRARQLSAAAISRVLAPRLRTALAQSIPGLRRNVRFGLFVLAFACFALALARPQYGFDSRDIRRKGLDVIIAVDTSKSMLATDIEPNRLTRAKLAALDLLALCKGDRLGVIAFAGRAFLMAPLTIDYGAVVNSIRELDTEVIPRGGTNLAEALQLAGEAFGKGEGADKVLVFLTDGEDIEGDALEQSKKAADAGVKIYCVGIGSTEGALLPLPGGQFIRDRSGQLVRSRLDEGKLREVAQAGGGQYVRLDGGPAVMETMYRDSISKLRAGETDSKTTQRPVQRFMWPLVVGVLALLGGLFVPERRRNGRVAPAPRRTAVAAALLLAFVPMAGAATAPASGREAMKQYAQGKYEDADNSFSDLVREHPNSPRLQFNLGTSSYQRKEYRRAAEAFGRALAGAPDSRMRASAHYNLGNTLFRQGETQKENKPRLRDWQDALKHYEASLEVDPNNPDARANRDLVRRLLQEAKQKQQKGKKDKKDKQDGEEGDDDEDEDGQPSKDKKQQKKKKKKKKDGDDKDKDKQQGEGEDGDDPPEDENGVSNERQDEEGGEAPDEQERQERRERAERNAPQDQRDQSKEGDLQARNGGEQKDEKGEPKTAQASELDPSRDGRLSPGQARRLLEALKTEDDRVILTDRPRRTEPVFKDW